MASNSEYEQQKFWPPRLSEELRNNGWVTEEFDGQRITYNRRFMNEFFFGDDKKQNNKGGEGKV